MDIRLEDVSVDLPVTDRRLFHIDALSLPTGARALIHGPSGRGKTTLLHLIAGLMLPSAGRVWLGDRELTGLADRERTRLRRAHIGIVFQKHNLLEHLTASENVELALPRERTARERAVEALARVGLESAARQRTAELSLGEQQRVAIARVLAAKPRVLLADEPTSSLDRANAERVTELLLDESGVETVVVVSHDERIHQRFTTLLDFTAWCPS